MDRGRHHGRLIAPLPGSRIVPGVELNLASLAVHRIECEEVAGVLAACSISATPRPRDNVQAVIAKHMHHRGGSLKNFHRRMHVVYRRFQRPLHRRPRIRGLRLGKPRFPAARPTRFPAPNQNIQNNPMQETGSLAGRLSSQEGFDTSVKSAAPYCHRALLCSQTSPRPRAIKSKLRVSSLTPRRGCSRRSWFARRYRFLNQCGPGDT